MSLKYTLIILSIFTLLMPTAYAVEEYHHILTLQSPNPETSGWFGYHVAIEGNLIVVNEPYVSVNGIQDAGKVYVFDTDGNLKYTLQSPSPNTTDLFGYRVDVHREHIIVGSQAYVNGLYHAGQAYVFSTNGTYLYSLVSPEPSSGGYFSTWSVALGDDIIVVSETKGEGAVHIYDYDGKYLRSLLSPSPIAIGKFGRGLEVGEHLILVGEFGHPTRPRGPGSVYVFDHDGNHLVTLQAPEPEELAMFGNEISVSGERIVIGEPYATVDGISRAGRAYIYNTDWELLQILQSPTPKMSGEFGKSVKIMGDLVVVGESFADVNPGLYEGKAYVYDIDGNLLQNLTAPDPCPRAAFGLDVDIDDDLIVIGEPWADMEGESQVGLVQVFSTKQPVTVQEPVEETTPVVEEEPETEDTGGWIPGFPVIALALGLIYTIGFLTQRKR